MPSFHHLQLPVAGAKSLVWKGDELVDWIGGADIYCLDGSRTSGLVRYRYRFDSVIQSPDGRYSVLYERLGTKGIVLKDGAVLREINRSYYHAHVYDFPITLFELPDGRPVIAHCPHDYNRLEIELLETGESLTGCREERAADIFHSCLSTNPSGTMLLSAGWVWHPIHVVHLYRVSDVLTAPVSLDSYDTYLRADTELVSATFLDDDRIALATDPNAENFGDEGDPDLIPHPGTLSVYRISTKTWESSVPFGETAGMLHAVDAEHVLALYQHPKLVHLPTGKIIERWPRIATGNWAGCIDMSNHDIPPLAWDAENKRLAVGTATQIHVLSLVV
ncbi:hypothetical protein [Labrys neptuniae]